MCHRNRIERLNYLVIIGDRSYLYIKYYLAEFNLAALPEEIPHNI